MIPGRVLHRLAARICSARSLERIVQPAIADLQNEYTHSRRGFTRLSALMKGYLAVVSVIGVCAFDLSEATDDDRHAVMRTLMLWLIFTTAIVTLLILPALSGYPTALKNWYGVMNILPQAMPLAIPIGLAFGIAVGSTARVTMSTAKAIVLAAFAASLLSFGVLEWAVPASGEAFREATLTLARSNGYAGAATLPKGISQMRLAELRREIKDAAAIGEFRRAQPYSWAFHMRFALAAAALVLAAFLLAVRVDRRLSRGLLAFAACFLYYILMQAGNFAMRQEYLTPFAGAWLPNFALTGLTIIVSSRTFRFPSGP
jgi:lipopolysaccharide export LptBFGC system permease protein LptF